MGSNVRINEVKIRNWSDEGLFRDNFSETSKRLVDDLAVSVLGGKGNVMVIGYPSVGKTYLVEQFISNIDHYTDMIPGRRNLIFFDLNRTTLVAIDQLPAGLDSYLEFLQNRYDRPQSDFCFITESPQIAETVASHYPEVSVILECNISTYRALIKGETHGASKTWSSWVVVDANETILDKTELVTALHYSLINEFYKDFGIEITRREITALVTYFLNNTPPLKINEGPDKGKTVAPPGLWAIPLRRYVGVKALSNERFQNKNGSFNVGRAIKSVYEDTIGLFMDALEMSGGDAPTLIIEGLPKELEEMFLAAAMAPGNEAEESPEVVSPGISYKPLDTLGERLSSKVIGQEDAVKSVAEGMMIPAAGLNDETKPLRSFLFLGPTGVGKTKLALTLAEELSDEPMNVVRLDMSEYSRDHEVSKLFGSPPGYAGHSEGGMLTNEVKKHPNSIVLLDEIEKAHPKVYDQFLQILDAGRMTTGSGETVDFTKAVVIMTSNLGSKEVVKTDLGFSPMSHAEGYSERQSKSSSIILKEVEKNFTPEFINRIDEKVIFDELSEETVKKIIVKELEILKERLKSRVELVIPSNDIQSWILSKSKVSKYGAREIQRVIAQEVSTPVAKVILSGKTDKIQFRLEDNNIIVEGVLNG